MRRGVYGSDALETINAAASAIASAESRVPQVSAQKRSWGSFWGRFRCFGSNKNKRIGHAVLVPETSATGSEAPRLANPSQPPSITLPFVAPPSSPASFLPSEPPSATQSPTGLSFTAMSSNMYSPGGPASIFAIGPYANETQLVSPPVFSTFTTEPSTAPYTPPPESVQLTTPSSPEVPFARLLEPQLQNGDAGQRYPLSHNEFQSYHLQPGSPVSHLISPSSGTSSPLPDRDFAPGHPFFIEFRAGDHPKLLNLGKIVNRDWESHRGSGSLTPNGESTKSQDGFLLNRQDSDIAPLSDIDNRLRNDEQVADHRVSFEITAEEVIRCVEKKPSALPEAVPETSENDEHVEVEIPSRIANGQEDLAHGTSNTTSEEPCMDEQRHKKNRTITFGSSKEFNFDNIDEGHCNNPNIGSDWWTNEKVLGEEVGPHKDWSFFPIMQTGVS